MDTKAVLRIKKFGWAKISDSSGSSESSGEKRGSKRWDVCKNCSFVMIPASVSCQQCNRQKQLRSMSESSAMSKLRPFMVPFKFTEPQEPDRYLNTANFQKFIGLILECIPTYLQSARVIQSGGSEQDISAVVSLTYSELYEHLMSLRIEHVQRWIRPILHKMMNHPRNSSSVFNAPVPLDYFPDYTKKIRRPMDLGTIRSRLQSGGYDSVAAGFKDIDLVFKNAMTFNHSTHTVHQLAIKMKNDFYTEVEAIQEKCTKDMERKLAHSCGLCQGASCPLCGEKCLKFEPQSMVCHGSCNQKIKRDSVFYVTKDGIMTWCQKCFSNLPSTIMEFTNRPALTKRDCLKRRTDGEVAEPWVSCDTCGHWVHQICALYNDRFLGGSAAVAMDIAGERGDRATENGWYQCPMCKLEYAAALGNLCEKSALKTEAEKSAAQAAEGGDSRFSAVRLATVCTPAVAVAESTPLVEAAMSEQENLSVDVQPSPSSQLSGKSDGTLAIVGFCRSVSWSGVKTDEEDGASSGATDDELEDAGSLLENKPVSPDAMYDDDKDSVSSLTAAMTGPPSPGAGVNETSTNSPRNPMDPVGTLEHTELEMRNGGDTHNSEDIEDKKIEEDVDRNLHRVAMDVDDGAGSASIVAKESSSTLSVRMETGLTCACFTDDCVIPGLCQVVVPGNVGSMSAETSMKIEKEKAKTVFSNSFPRDPALDFLCAGQKQWRASALPRSKVSDFIEQMVMEKLQSLGLGEVASTISIRLTSNTAQKMEVPDPVIGNTRTAASTKVHSKIGYRQKSIFLFQNIDGVDVCLFALYVNEFDADAPAPNQSVVYIAYLDSVDYFRPMQARTAVYHEILVAYLKWVQMRGFKRCHIWACPPQRGDNFIFWCHPSHQRTPSRERLTAWYNSMLRRAEKLGVVSQISNLWAEHFTQYTRKDGESHQRHCARQSLVGSGALVNAQKGSQAQAGCFASSSSDWDTHKVEDIPVCPPIFEGDYWVGEFLRIHRQVSVRMKGSDGQDCGVNIRRCKDCLKNLMAKHIASPFLCPVDALALNIPEYLTIVKYPMDLGTVRDNLRINVYPTMEEFAQSVRLVFSNAMLFNPPAHYIHVWAKALTDDFEVLMLELATEIFGPSVSSENLDKWLLQMPIASTTTSSSSTSITATAISISCEATATLSSISEDSTMAPAVDPHISGSSDKDHPGNEYFIPWNRMYQSQSVGGQGRNDAVGEGEGAMEKDGDNAEETDVLATKPHLGFKAALSLMADLSKSVFRLKEDLFVVKFASSDGSDSKPCTKPKRRRVDNKHAGMVRAGLPISSSHAQLSELSGRREVASALDDIIETVEKTSVGATECEYTQRQPKLHNLYGEEATKSVSFDHATLTYEGRSVPTSVSAAETTTTILRRRGGRAKETARRGRGRPAGRTLTAPIPIPSPQGGGGGGEKETTGTTNAGGRKNSRADDEEEDEDDEENYQISTECAALLAALKGDTSDPDELHESPFCQSRHTFLEMCQYRQYQFDSLRRAKYSSALLLYHLHHPADPSTQPLCSLCRQPIREVRWHCDLCQFDACTNCCAEQDLDPLKDYLHPCHEHPLTPFRLSYT